MVDIPSTDEDGDLIVYSYEWTDPSGASAQTITEVSDTSDVFLASGTVEGLWTCEVTPFDGTDDGLANSATAAVEEGCQSLQFDGVDDFIEIAQSQNENLQGELTVEAWYYGDDLVINNDQWLFAKHDCGYSNGHIMGLLDEMLDMSEAISNVQMVNTSKISGGTTCPIRQIPK